MYDEFSGEHIARRQESNRFPGESSTFRIYSRTLSKLPANTISNPSEEILRKAHQGHTVIHYDMNNRSCHLFMLIICICAASHWLDAQTPKPSKPASESSKATAEPGKQTPEPGKPTPKPGEQKEFISLQRLVPRLYDGQSWTREDKVASDLHFVQFMEAAKSGQLILAGRTKEEGEKMLGIVVFRASDEAAARAFVKSDPLVSAGLMNAELHPFALALENANPPPPNAKTFIYVLRLVPRLHNDNKWTKEDKAALDRHFTQLKEAAKSGELILAGRTKEPGNKTFGIAIFRAADEAAAQKFMESDPAVVAKIMTAELHPFNVHIQRKAP